MLPAILESGEPVSSSCAGDRSSSGVVSVRMLRYSHSEGSCWFSGLAFHSAARSASRSSARPRRVSFCLRVSQSRSEGTR